MINKIVKRVQRWLDSGNEFSGPDSLKGEDVSEWFTMTNRETIKVFGILLVGPILIFVLVLSMII